MKKLLEYLLTNIVDHPEEVRITENEDENGMSFMVEVNKEDIGKVIGKNGQVINAIRSLVKTKAFKENKRVQINLNVEYNV